MAEETLEEHHEEDAPKLDPEAEARRVAAMSFIRKLGDPVLKSSATPVDRFDDGLRDQVARMGAIMRDAIGVGLAAPQVGLSQRLLVYQVGHDSPVIAVVNPEVDAARAIRERMSEAGVPALGPAPLFRRQARHRAQLVVRSQDRAGAIAAARRAATSGS